MDKKNIIPHQTQPVMRVTLGTQTDLLSELSEETLSDTSGASASFGGDGWSVCVLVLCSYDGDDVE